MTDISHISENTFSASVAHDGHELVVRLEGSADVHAKPHLEALLGTVDDSARELAVDEVRVDIRQLAFLNSSCFKDFISWLDRVRDAAPDKQYRVRFLSSVNRHWQKRSLHALSCFAHGLVTIEPS